MSETNLVPAERVEQAILLVRGHKVILDSDLATLYGVEVKALNQAVKRNAERFPADFMFRLTTEEVGFLRCQSGTSNEHDEITRESLRSQSVTSKNGRGGRRYLPYVFTEQGVAMLSSVLHSPRAVLVNIEIMRAFVRLRRMLQQNADLARQLAALEKKYDARFQVVFDAIRRLMAPGDRTGRPIGFRREGS